MMNQDTFSTFHPMINFIFYLGAFIFGMFLMHPAFLACSLLFSAAYYVTVRKRSGVSLLLGLVPVFLFLSAVNPLFNTYGETVLFTYFGGRPYTLEALFYGMALAAMFVSVILWFASYSAVMTSDKFLYLFGRWLPSVSLILTMVLRLAPDYQKKIRQIEEARKGIGMSAESGSRRERVRHGLTILSSMTSWALEEGIITADSMRSRGFGCGRRTSFSIYRFEKRDRFLLTGMLALTGTVIFCVARGAAAAMYTPSLELSHNQPYLAIGIAAYFIFLSIPVTVNLTEEIIWRSLKSGI